MLTEADLTPDQDAAWRWLAEQEEAFVPAPIGWGKTIVTLMAIKKIREAHPTWRTLVFSTKRILEQTWPSEIQNWSQLQGLTYDHACGRRDIAVLSRPDVLGVNFENIEWFYDIMDDAPFLLPEILVIDESHHMKSFAAARVKRHCGFLGRGKSCYLPKFQHRYALSGTLAPEGYADLYTQECSISTKRRLGPNITTFRAQYCSEHAIGERRIYAVHAGGRKEIEERLRPITLQVRMDRYLETPPPIFSSHVVPWSEKARKEYDRLERDFELDLRAKLATVQGSAVEGLSLEQLIDRGIDAAVAPNTGVLLSKLRQACSGFVFDSLGNARLLSGYAAKLEALAEIRDRAGDTPLLVFTAYVPEAEMIRQRFGAVVGLPKDLRAWNAREIPMLVLNPESAGEGLNLQLGTNICVYYTLPWSYGQYKQSWGRIDRRSQTEQCSVIRLMRPNSVDDYVWSKILDKGARNDEYMNNVTRR